MSSQQPLQWCPQQQRRLELFDIDRCIDVHCHILPGIDDGPTDLAQAVELARALVDDGITTVCATPHQLGRYDRLNSAEVVEDGIAELAAELSAAEIPLELLVGGDVRVDERLPTLLDAGEIVSLAGAGRHLLLELPYELLVDPLPAIILLQQRGLQAIMTHPERHPYLAESESLLRGWVERGAVIQLTAGSLLGDFGRRAHAQAWEIVDWGLASLVATDAHDVRRRPPCLTQALQLLTRELGTDLARQLCIDNPLRVLGGNLISLA